MNVKFSVKMIGFTLLRTFYNELECNDDSKLRCVLLLLIFVIYFNITTETVYLAVYICYV